MEAKPEIRWMIRRDMPEVLNIENDVFEYPWESGMGMKPPPPDSFMDHLMQRNTIGTVTVSNGHVAAYMIHRLYRTRIHVLNFAVRRDLWRHGIGTFMIDHLVLKLTEQRRRRLIFNVRESNLPMQLFLRSFGFRAVSVLEGEYDETTEDAYRFVLRHQSTVESSRA